MIPSPRAACKEGSVAVGWLYVVSGRGRATVEGRAVTIRQGSLLLIAAGEHHEIKNDGAHPLVTINVYAPPAY